MSNLIHTSNVTIIAVHEYEKPFPDEDILGVMTLFSRKNITSHSDVMKLKIKLLSSQYMWNVFLKKNVFKICT